MEEETYALRAPLFKEIAENIRLHRRHTVLKPEEADVCQCRPEGDIGCLEACLNRSLFVECMPGTCPCGEACQNQRLQKRQWAKISLFYFGAKGWGVVAAEPLMPGELVVEYIGEVCDLTEAERRARRYERTGLTNTYIMNLNSNEVIDATECGNYSRFINHSCNPNAECQKWTVGGENRIAIFAAQEINVGEEITYNYNLDWNGGRRVKCRCGSYNCTGFLGAESVLWRKTVDACPEFTEPLGSMELHHESMLISNNGFLTPVHHVMTRSKVVQLQRYGIEPCLMETPMMQKRRKLDTENEAEDRTSTSATWLEAPQEPQEGSDEADKKLGDSKETVPNFQPRTWPLMVSLPLPQKYTIEDPPGEMQWRSFDVALLSVTDVVSLSDLIRDPYLTFNQEYYLTVGDVTLKGLLYSNASG